MSDMSKDTIPRGTESRLGAVARRLEAIVPLSQADREVLGRLPHSGEFPAGHELIALGSVLIAPKFLLSGWACLSRNLTDGRRQIVDLFVPGDLVGYCSRSLPARGAYHLIADGRCADAAHLRELQFRGDLPDGLRTCLRRIEDEQQARLVDHIVRLGSMYSHERFAQLVQDLHRRLDRVGMVTADSFAVPLTQEMLGDMLGMSAVHVNRTVQVFRREKILKTSPGRWQILDHDRLGLFASGEHGRLGTIHVA
ncbi:MAG: Crp/Fnr family transcriptional regulator [Alphaproteobacteria bacterium]|nr:Crp/Fnr family transcriptional regulator [Alphaproteobacteria bacterium]MBL7099511.1 Crp/Fnr family transcriptional regulator [Alphaproteobacteria bacterium]